MRKPVTINAAEFRAAIKAERKLLGRKQWNYERGIRAGLHIAVVTFAECLAAQAKREADEARAKT